MRACEGDLRDTLGVHVIGFDEGQPLRVGFDFHEATFDEPQRERAKGHFLSLFDGMLRDLDTQLAQVELVSAQERAELLVLGRGANQATPATDPLFQFASVSEARALPPAFQGPQHHSGELSFRPSLAPLGLGGMRHYVAFCAPRCLRAAYVASYGSEPTAARAGLRDRIRIFEDAAQGRITLGAAARLDVRRRACLADEELGSAQSERCRWPPMTPSIAYVCSLRAPLAPMRRGTARRSNFLRSMAHTQPDVQTVCGDHHTPSNSRASSCSCNVVGRGGALPTRDRADSHMIWRAGSEAITGLQATLPPVACYSSRATAARRGPQDSVGGDAIAELAQRLLAPRELWNM